MKNRKDVVAGLGEIGLPIQKLLSKTITVVGYDKRSELIDISKTKRFEKYETEILHVCIPFTKNFISDVKELEKKFKPEIIAVHSTVEPSTTQKLQKKITVPVIYSPLRGVHARKQDSFQPHKKGMLFDIKRYVKFYSVQNNTKKDNLAAQKFNKRLKNCGLKTKKMSMPITLELAKILCDTSYYGWLIAYAQLTDILGAYEKIKTAKSAGLDLWEGIFLALFILKDLLIIGGILATIIWYIKEKNVQSR